jgi:hypothetical protein
MPRDLESLIDIEAPIMYAPQATLSLQQKLQQQLMGLPQALDLLRQSPDLTLDCIDDQLTQRFFRHFPQNHTLPPLVPLLLWQGCYYIASPFRILALRRRHCRFINSGCRNPRG